ncbi:MULTISPECIES: hypothetical protein [Arthrobacter]|uniref:Uncharacterized protein n=1 Tax=Arthrobacter terricola TaxID=2547396 RepID=A0A4R5KF57_9MICC|nr:MULTISPECIES: hypothetical protein [Arthrobacter]MBT8162553.1 hypothetical protein [Arthrobacter sp. GN70]TDF92887.1 hypothetical protein E1809_17165 [Arthrobacter terricola]
MVAVAPERRIIEDGIHAEMMPSANPDDDLAMHNRRDPYWDRLWAPGSQANWVTGPMARHHKKEGLSPVNAKLLLNEDEALRIATSNRGRTERLAAWGVLDSWRTVSAEQLAALTGCRYFLDPNYSSMAASFSLDLIDVGTYANKLRLNPGMNSSVVFRIANSEAFGKVIEPTLTGPEWLSVTAGHPWSTGGQYDRHNVLSTEFGLRAAEYLDIGAVLGEKLSSVDLLAGSGLGKKIARPDGRRADGTIVRNDGLRIAFELTATASPAFENKVRRWAQVIAERPLETSGLTVVFIAAPHPDRSRRTSTDPRHEIYRTLAKVLREFPGRGQDSPAARIGIAHWEEWFPDRHLISEAFLSLKADFAINDATGPDRWATRGMLTDYAFEPWCTFDATAVLENSRLLAATPHWMRKGDHTHLIGSPMDRAGVNVPHPAPAKPHLTKGRPLGAAVGNGGDAKLPRRLRTEW